MSHFLYPSQLLVRLPHLDRLFENLLERQTLHEELERTINGSNSNNSITTQASGDVHNDKYSNNNQNTSSEYKCWICWDIIDTSKEQWIRPCKCSLVSHQQCLLSWIIENQRLSPRKKVREYKYIYIKKKFETYQT
jgi:E3 ubiquitin-protein ligase DOA10